MSEELLRVEAISKAFGGVQVLQDVSLLLRSGEVLALVGANGAGKSTLIKVICGAYAADKGTIFIDGQQQNYRNVREAVAAGVSVAHQNNMTISRLTGAQNIELGREPTRFGLIDKRELRRRAEALWRVFDVNIDINAECGDLGPGEQKIVDILKALATDPRILILDEPTATLTLGESKRLFAFIDQLRTKNIGVIFISHHLQEVLDHCDSVVVLKDGRLVHQGVVDNNLTREDIVQMMIGRSVVQEKRASSAVAGETVVSVENLKVGSLHVNRFEAARGEVVGIAGLIGAGQTEFLQCLAGARRPSQAGSVELFAKPGLPKTVGDAVLDGIYSVPADRIHTAIFGALTVEENLSTASLSGLSSKGFISSRTARARAGELISALAIKCAGQDQKVQELSGGNQQKVSFARWLSRPGLSQDSLRNQIFLLDNPTEGVDVGAKAEFYDLIGRLAIRGGTVIVTSAEFTELIAICDRIYCISNSTLSDHFPAVEMTEETLLLKTN
ncbi:MAG: sugar ABC transporter ATP-binding protein [Mesorhizobium sp.]|uniref:sugar ABC transporter ATP-binding protein n=1 Tax=unclassified Mesorhizobium TaxID=325217 RepID=UPI000FE49E51|nr:MULTISPECIES: sugar ABC transporter ATP-binding protein [unclassified Mesorhizobium]RWE28148.1 MAG: sugar ABC transporter ATP-binding protein [Mesorhizobium sp.]TGP87910.1 sugar ABC transporter ATP-binding protein [Mesorhizobium sp. M8A.F.Ca.ET.218.01.1.1]TGT15708.1 sugar ABC transporter ATP-binding protein [Mesorhizobium sp. M8A.F.Ca.ET.213.01.1.1]